MFNKALNTQDLKTHTHTHTWFKQESTDYLDSELSERGNIVEGNLERFSRRIGSELWN